MPAREQKSKKVAAAAASRRKENTAAAAAAPALTQPENVTLPHAQPASAAGATQTLGAPPQTQGETVPQAQNAADPSIEEMVHNNIDKWWARFQ